LAYVSQAFQFLVTDFAYVDIGSIPVTTPEVQVRGYANAAARVQVEVSGHPMGHTFHGLIRRLIGGAPAPYSDTGQLLEFYEIAMIRQPKLELSHNVLGWEGAVDAAAKLLRDNSDLVTGERWIPRAEIRRAWDRNFARVAGLREAIRRFGWKRVVFGATDAEADMESGSLLDEFRSAFAFLLDLGYELTVDTDLLSPHEYLVAPELRYENGAHHVVIQCVDFRDQEWVVERDGQRVGEIFNGFREEIAPRAAMVRKDLSASA
jgi:hypothetical protein